jgi:hypothetical protein
VLSKIWQAISLEARKLKSERRLYPLCSGSAAKRNYVIVMDEGSMFSHFCRLLSLGAMLLSLSFLPSVAADVTIRITGTSGETASVVLDTDAKKWAGTNGPNGDLLKARSGIYKAGTNLTPGFAVKGTGLFEGGDEKKVEAFLYDLIPSEATASGNAQMLGTGTNGTWTRR